MSALEQADALRSGAISSVELTAAYLDRISVSNPELTALLSASENRALKGTRRADKRQASGEAGPFNGVPTASKILILSAPFNVSGQPAVSIPAGLRSDGMPMGVQLVGPLGGDVRLLQVARQLEVACPWRHLYGWCGG